MTGDTGGDRGYRRRQGIQRVTGDIGGEQGIQEVTADTGGDMGYRR